MPKELMFVSHIELHRYRYIEKRVKKTEKDVFIQGVSMCMSTFTLCALAIDRYIVIVHPQRMSITASQARYISGYSLLFSAVTVAPPVVFRQVTPVGNFCGVFCLETWPYEFWPQSSYGLLSLFITFFCPLYIIGCCYAKVIQSINRVRIVKRFNDKKYRKH